MADYKQLCVELLSELENAIRVIHAEDGTRHISGAYPVINMVKNALAEPEPEPEITHDGSSNKPTAKELQSLWQACNSPSVFARAVLARWGRPALPIPVTDENLPGPKDRDAEGRCWWFCPQCPGEYPHWILAKEAYCAPTHWLPAHALTSAPFS